MRCRIATLLGPNTVDGLRRIGSHLSERGFDPSLVAIDSAGSDIAAAVAEARIDMLWACGLLTAELVASGAGLEVVAVPVFAGEEAPVYRSVIIARRGETTPGRRLAVNEFGSWSGYRALFHDAAVRSDDRWHPDGMAEIVVTGAHVASAVAVADGRADVAAIDHSVWNWLAANDPVAIESLEVVDRTVGCPAPPFSLGSAIRGDDRADLVEALFGFAGPPLLLPASIDDYAFMIA